MILSQKKEKINSFKADVISEKPSRSILKSISWRIIGTFDTILISWFVTKTLTIAFSIGAIELITKMVLYFFHERVWNIVKWGKE